MTQYGLCYRRFSVGHHAFLGRCNFDIYIYILETFLEPYLCHQNSTIRMDAFGCGPQFPADQFEHGATPFWGLCIYIYIYTHIYIYGYMTSFEYPIFARSIFWPKFRGISCFWNVGQFLSRRS